MILINEFGGPTINLHIGTRIPRNANNVKIEKKNKPLINRQISAKEVRLIGAEGEQLGITEIKEALSAAEQAGLDLVEIAANASPPVCRIMDFGKYLFELGKKQKNKAKKVQLKELKLRPVTDVGDYLVKIKRAIDFLKDGDKVKFTIRFRGREISYQQQGLDVLRRIEQDLAQYGVLEFSPKVEGKQLVMVIVPGKNKI